MTLYGNGNAKRDLKAIMEKFDIVSIFIIVFLGFALWMLVGIEFELKKINDQLSAAIYFLTSNDANDKEI